MRKKRQFAILALLIAFLIISYVFIQGSNDAKVVLELPDGFIALEEAIASSGGTLRYVFWESQISFLDFDRNVLYQTDVKNKAFIVKYNRVYYINEAKFWGFAVSSEASNSDVGIEMERRHQ